MAAIRFEADLREKARRADAGFELAEGAVEAALVFDFVFELLSFVILGEDVLGEIVRALVGGEDRRDEGEREKDRPQGMDGSRIVWP